MSVINPVRQSAWPFDVLAFTVSTTVPYTTHKQILSESTAPVVRRRSKEGLVSGAMGIYSTKYVCLSFVTMSVGLPVLVVLLICTLVNTGVFCVTGGASTSLSCFISNCCTNNATRRCYRRCQRRPNPS